MSLSERLLDLFRKQTHSNEEVAESAQDLLREGVLQDEQREQLEKDRQILESPDDSKSGEIDRKTKQQLRVAAEASLKRLHVIQHGRCPQCGEHLRQHLFASICDSCGWNSYDTPRKGNVRVHLSRNDEVIAGERCYILKDGTHLVLGNDAVIARLHADAVGWVEYLWTEDELETRHKEVLEHLTIDCGWCNQVCDPEAEGFHVAQVAFGSTQERYVFCCDECYEAFRKMYPARVHRNCYERSCTDCNLCTKRYEDESEGIRMIAKDHLHMKRRKNGSSESKA